MMYNKNSIAKSFPKLFWVLVVSCFVAVSCDDDNGGESMGEPYFMIEEDPTSLSVSVEGISQKYVVRSNRDWKVVAQSDNDWVEAFPNEGDNDGIFRFNVDPNDSFEDRTANFAFVVDGQEQPVLFRIDQEANVPYITILNAENGISVPSAGGEVNIALETNVEWTYILDDESWITGVEQSENALILQAEKNTGLERSITLTIQSTTNGLLEEVEITQSAGNVILEEDFSWLTYGNRIFYETAGEKRIDDGWTEEELARGWTSTENTFTSNQKVVYARPGFVKLGKTNYGGDLISPPLAALDGPTDVQVTFKAVPYETAGGTQDDNNLIVGVVGPGTTSVPSFTVSNYPDYDADPDCVLIWEDESSTYTFTITGATAETQLRFLGGAFDLNGVGAGKNRIFIDDIKVVIIN
ncbi:MULTISPECIES: BACON domain-containing protein [Flagellimonas]|uniref:BACON domain-containing protein n=1 Tax=Flagellimonas hadalis TaxID=2597517 RepID=A0A5N5J2K1_9FLAO|nr:BACON domain-containing carbohydrate-binding protein [Allomuricauda hadalis]KAB5488181.1 BACON domain-containing protein [Allomuricauda hadalis]